MKNRNWQTFLAAVAGVFLLSTILCPGSTFAFDSSDYDDGQDKADMLMWGALGLLAVALIIQIAKADDAPATTADKGESAPESRESGESEEMGATIHPVAGISHEGAMMGFKLDF